MVDLPSKNLDKCVPEWLNEALGGKIDFESANQQKYELSKIKIQNMPFFLMLFCSKIE